MDKAEERRLIRAYKMERDPTKKERIHAVCMVKINGLGISNVASVFYCGPRTITNWVRRYDQEGLAGLEPRLPKPRPKDAARPVKRRINSRTSRMLYGLVCEKLDVDRR